MSKRIFDTEVILVYTGTQVKNISFRNVSHSFFFSFFLTLVAQGKENLHPRTSNKRKQHFLTKILSAIEANFRTTNINGQHEPTGSQFNFT